MNPVERTTWSAKRLLPVLGILLAVGFLLYVKTFSSGWTLDDFPVIVNNPDVTSLSNFLKDAYPGRPLRELSFLIDHALFGLQPAGWHIQQIFWHCLNAFLLFALVMRLVEKPVAAWTASLIFLVHPLQVEVVANISHRKDSLALAFCLISLLAYLRGIGMQRFWRGILWSAAFWLVAVSAKQNAALLPLAWLAYELAFVPVERRFLLRRHAATKLWALALAACVGATVFWFRQYGSYAAYFEAMNAVMAKMGHHMAGGDMTPYVLMVMKSFLFMARRLVWPYDLAPEYVFSVPEGWSDPLVLGASALFALYLLLLVVTFRLRRRYFFALAWMGLFWLPVSNLLPLSYFAADRYLYAPLAGLALAAGFIAEDTVAQRRALQPVFAGVVVLLAVLTWMQTGVWRSQETLWLQAARVNPESTTALNNLGTVYLRSGELEKAERYFSKATKNFNDPMPYYNLGRVYEKMGRKEEALRNYRYFLAFRHKGYRTLARELKQRIYRKYGVTLR